MVEPDADLSQPDSLREIIRFLTVPALSGVYLTVPDLQRVGQAAGLQVFAHSRRMAIEQLFRAAALDNKVGELIEALISEVEAQRASYRRESLDVLEDWGSRAGRTVELLQRMSAQAGRDPIERQL